MTTTAITCTRCRRTVQVTHDALRAAIDADQPPPCKWCVGKRLAKPQRPKRPVTAAELVLLTTFAMVGETGEVNRSDLVVECWKRNTEIFGLKGYNAKYLDSKRVDSEIAHLIGDGHLERARPLYYRVTDVGVAKVRAMQMKRGK